MADEFNQQLSEILNDPAAMQKIMNLAQNLASPNQDSPKKENVQVKDNDLAALQNITKLAAQGSIDRQQQNLLSALSPYLSKDKINKLENAMRAAKMTRIATSFISSQKRSIGR